MNHININIFVVFALIITSISCKTAQKMFDPKNTKSEYLFFGSGGGFTGKVIKYYLTSSGDLYTETAEGISRMGKMESKNSKQIFNIYTSMSLHQININEPGNRYYFIEKYHGNEPINSIKWGAKDIENPTIETFYAILMKSVSKMSISNQQN
ncbi:MAG: hypothetical protein WAU01_14015 [Saprospiraceae bacterium]